MTDTLATLRKRIDCVDRELLKLLNKRAVCAVQVGKSKTATGDTNFYCPDREAQVLRHLQQLNQGPLGNETIARFFREIMSSCLALEQAITVAFLGPAGTFTQQAAYKHFGTAITPSPAATIDDIFAQVETQRCQFGVVPIENSTQGIISQTLDRFVSSSAKICGEVTVRIHHHLVGNCQSLSQVTQVLAHEQSLAQCQKWLASKLPNATLTPVSSNAQAAKLLAGSNNKMAIASKVAADLYGLRTLASNIEDSPCNTTRFLIIGAQDTSPSGADKTSLLVATGNQTGSLHKILAPFAKHGINLSHVQSRPSKLGLWEYVFFIDISGHKDDENVALALKSLQKNDILLNILGSYPKGVI